MIGYHIHHHGVGHLSRATTTCSELHLPVTGLTSLDVPSHHAFADILWLPRDDDGVETADPTARNALHWVPHHHRGLTARMTLIARWVQKTWPAAAVVVDVSDIGAADVVVTHAGQGCVADVAAPRRPAIVLPQYRPFGEQDATADALCRHRLPTVIGQWPSPHEWEGLIARARAADANRWELWQTEGAATRTATAIEATAHRCAATGRP